MTHNPAIDLIVVAAFAAVFAVPVIREYLRNKNAPKPTGATKI